jgi:hypothetical protein
MDAQRLESRLKETKKAVDELREMADMYCMTGLTKAGRLPNTENTLQGRIERQEMLDLTLRTQEDGLTDEVQTLLIFAASVYLSTAELLDGLDESLDILAGDEKQ